MEPRRLLAIARRRAPLLVVIFLIGLLGGYLGSDRTSEYRAEAYLYVGQPITSKTTATQMYGQNILAVVLAPVVANPTTAAAAVAATHVARSPLSVAEATSAVAIPNSSILLLTVQDTDPVVSEELTNATAAAFASEAASLPPVLAAAGVTDNPSTSSPTTTPSTSTGPATKEVVSVYRQALLPSAVGNHAARTVALGGLAGLVIGLALVALIDLTGLVARTPRQIEAQLDIPVLGVVPRLSQLAGSAEGKPPERWGLRSGGRG